MNRLGVAVILSMLGLLMFTGLGAPAAQGEHANSMEVLRQKVHSDKRLLVAENMDLSESEAKVFWPLYEKYQKDLDSMDERSKRLMEEYAASYDSLSDKTAGEILKDYILIEKDRQKFREYYLTRFNSCLPRKKVARYFQLENKVQAIRSYELASKIPLAR